MLSQDSKRPGDTVEGYSCPSCIGLETYFPKINRLKRKYYETWPYCPGFGPFYLRLALVCYVEVDVGSTYVLFTKEHAYPKPAFTNFL